ncbi:unnamed protein product [Pleuronectes platessa]|uniref:Uncharacterized protein n=1 Tax=Pleuronectes platessa TaxID=8262 RepID=A0A9N7YYE7_PLEPL|nr:unnamed protein product [Pleuronectes platessa]
MQKWVLSNKDAAPAKKMDQVLSLMDRLPIYSAALVSSLPNPEAATLLLLLLLLLLHKELLTSSSQEDTQSSGQPCTAPGEQVLGELGALLRSTETVGWDRHLDSGEQTQVLSVQSNQRPTLDSLPIVELSATSPPPLRGLEDIGASRYQLQTWLSNQGKPTPAWGENMQAERTKMEHRAFLLLSDLIDPAAAVT